MEAAAPTRPIGTAATVHRVGAARIVRWMWTNVGACRAGTMAFAQMPLTVTAAVVPPAGRGRIAPMELTSAPRHHAKMALRATMVLVHSYAIVQLDGPEQRVSMS